MMKLYVFGEESSRPSEWTSGGRQLVLARDVQHAKEIASVHDTFNGGCMDPVEVCMDEEAVVADVEEPP